MIDPINHKELAVSRLATQFRESTNLINYIRTLVNESDNLEQVFNDILSTRAIDTSSGVNLDILGSLVGQNQEIVTKEIPFFGFFPGSNSLSFGSVNDPSLGGRFRSVNERANLTRLLSDEEYRIWIRAKIVRNSTNSTPENIISMLGFVLGLTNVKFEDGDTEYTVVIQQELTEEQRIVLNSNIIPKTLGVSVNYVEIPIILGYDSYMESLEPSAYYRLDSNGIDKTGNGYDFTINGSPTTSPSLYGGDGSSLTFTESDNMVIKAGEFPPMTNGRTVSMWVKTTNTDDFAPMYCQDGGIFGYVMLTPSVSSSNGFTVVKRSGNTYTYAYGYYSITDGEPHFITVVEEPGNTYVYVDGTFASRKTGGFLSEQNNQPIRLGYSAKNPGFKGTLDGLLLDNKVLSHFQIAEAYKLGRKKTTSIGYDYYVASWLSVGTASFYKLDSNAGEDSLSRGRDMTAAGALSTLAPPLCLGSTNSQQFDGVAHLWRSGMFTYSNARTIGFWIQVNPGEGTDKTIYSQYTAEFNGTKIIASDSTLNGNMSLQLNGQSRFDSGFAIDDGLPHFVVIVDRTSTLSTGTQFYLDGMPYNRTYSAFGLLSYGTSYFSLAAKVTAPGSSNVSEQLPCILDGFFITSNSPTYEQVIELYENGVIPAEAAEYDELVISLNPAVFWTLNGPQDDVDLISNLALSNDPSVTDGVGLYTGSIASNQYIIGGSATHAVNSPAYAGARSVSVWFSVDEITLTYVAVYGQYIDNNNRGFITLNTDQLDQSIRYWSDIGALDSGVQAVLGETYHVVVTADSSGSKIYINGVFTNEWAGTDVLSRGAGGTTGIGTAWFNNSGAGKFKGNIDGLAIFNNALTEEQVTQLYNAGIGA